DAELPGGEYSGVARNQTAVLAHQRRRRPAPLLDARGYRGDLSVRVCAGIFRIRDQPNDRPPLDLIGRPRPLISGSLARVRAPARRRGSVGASVEVLERGSGLPLRDAPDWTGNLTAAPALSQFVISGNTNYLAKSPKSE